MKDEEESALGHFSNIFRLGGGFSESPNLSLTHWP